MDSYIIDWRQPITTEIRQFIDEDVIGGIADLLSNRLKLQEELIDALNRTYKISRESTKFYNSLYAKEKDL